MAIPRLPELEMLLVAAFSRHENALDWARARLEQEYGPILLTSPPFAFNQTEYYEKEMGSGLRKVFLVFRNLRAAEELPAIKLRTNALEQELASRGGFPENRPLNLDPGLLSLGKFILATTKDQAHRLYLRDGIYAEVTLRFQDGHFHPWSWTYADYRQLEVLSFLERARDAYRELRQVVSGAGVSPTAQALRPAPPDSID